MSRRARVAAARALVVIVAVATLSRAGDVVATGGPAYSAAEVAHFEALGLGSEYGGASPVVRKWQGGVRVALAGQPTDDDRAAIRGAIADLRKLIAPVGVELVARSPDVTVRMVPADDFASVVPGYVPGNDGFFRVWWQANVIDRAEIVVDAGAPPDIRAHLIRHELTQSLGLMIDSDDPASVLFGRPTSVTAFTTLDRAALRLLYDPRVRPGMSATQVEDAIAP